MLKFHNKSKSFATMAVKDYKVDNPFGLLATVVQIYGLKKSQLKDTT